MFCLDSSRGNAMTFAVGLVNKPQQMMIVNMLDLVGQNYKFAIDLIEFSALEVIAKLLASQAQSVPPGVFAEHQLRVWHSHRLRRHDFIRQAVLEHAVL